MAHSGQKGRRGGGAVPGAGHEVSHRLCTLWPVHFGKVWVGRRTSCWKPFASPAASSMTSFLSPASSSSLFLSPLLNKWQSDCRIIHLDWYRTHKCCKEPWPVSAGDNLRSPAITHHRKIDFRSSRLIIRFNLLAQGPLSLLCPNF